MRFAPVLIPALLLASLPASLVAAAPERVALHYRFAKGMVSHVEQTQTFKQEIFAENRIVRWRIETEIVLDRTVLAVDDDAQPTIERVTVKKWRFKTLEHPEEEPGEKSDASEGLTFVWREYEGSWRLFAEGDRDVTDRLPALTKLLAGWRKARLPEEPVGVGDTWEADAERFSEASGVAAAQGTRGRAVFTLEKVAGGVADIGFDMTFAREDAGMKQEGRATGTMRFDVERGRDVSTRMNGRVEFDDGNKGFAEIGMERTITYPDEEEDRAPGHG